MKRSKAIALIAVLLILPISLPLPAMAQKRSSLDAPLTKAEARTLEKIFEMDATIGVTSSDLDATVAILIGKGGFYQLTDDENGITFNMAGQLEPFGRKSYARVTGINLQRNEDGSLFLNAFGRFQFERDPVFGNIVLNLYVMRDGMKGGAFDKVKARFTDGGDPGTFRTIQPGDLVGL